MTNWTVTIEAEYLTSTEERAEMLLETLAQDAPAVEYGPGRLGATVRVPTPSLQDALSTVLPLFAQVIEAPATGVEIQRAA
jgi:hypothetical protein